jgi:L-asparagine transporter-like permease
MDKIEKWLVRITVALIVIMVLVQIGIHEGRTMARHSTSIHKEAKNGGIRNYK